MNREPRQDFAHDAPPSVGVLLINLGTPDAPSAAAVRRYLAEFLWDQRVVEIPRSLWWLILHGIVLRRRPAKVAKAYQAIWTAQGSPLLAISRRQRGALQAYFDQRPDNNVVVSLAMRYGSPSIASALCELREQNIHYLLVLPLYPQYSAATAASAFDALAAELASWRWVPALNMITAYHDSPGYIDALVQSVRAAWSAGSRHDRLLFSFHGMPYATLLAGDPYHCQCWKTARLVAERLGLGEQDWALSFQSRFGRAKWLQPYTSKTLADWGKAGLASVDVICPGFAADCLETLEEIEQENRATFQRAGGGEFRYIPALNDRAEHIEALAQLVDIHTQAWPAQVDREQYQSAGQRIAERAKALGAKR